MQTETEQIFTEQIGKLPPEIVDYVASTDWNANLDTIAVQYTLSPEEIAVFKREVTLVLMGLVHPDEFGGALKQEFALEGITLDPLIATTEQQIFVPILPALLAYFEKEEDEEVESENLNAESDAQEIQKTTLSPEKIGNLGVELPSTPPSTEKIWAKKPDIAPDNLPTSETESFLPTLAPKPTNLEVQLPSEGSEGAPLPPFEEKMKRVFTAGKQSLDELMIETPSTPPTPPRTYHADPYREAIE